MDPFQDLFHPIQIGTTHNAFVTREKNAKVLSHRDCEHSERPLTGQFKCFRSPRFYKRRFWMINEKMQQNCFTSPARNFLKIKNPLKDALS